MKKITALIRSERLTAVRDALNDIEISGMIISSIEGVGQQEGHIERYRGNAYYVDYIPQMKVEVLIEAERADECCDVIMSAARTGKLGDGKIIISPVERVIRIRTGEEDERAM